MTVLRNVGAKSIQVASKMLRHGQFQVRDLKFMEFRDESITKFEFRGGFKFEQRYLR